jgi:GT2 family glycosyltransferase
MNSPQVSIVIGSRNRKEELARAIESGLAQTDVTCEVLVLDDGSTDGTVQEIPRRFPEVRFFSGRNHDGVAARRNEGLRQAAGKYVFFIDDDAYFTRPGTLAEAIEVFEQHPEVALIALRFVEPNRDVARDMSHLAAALPEARQIRNFIACACGVRRDAMLEIDGFRAAIRYRGEERDLAIRFIDRGYQLRYVDTPAIVHSFSAQRDWDECMLMNIRNQYLFTIFNVPFPTVVPRLLKDFLGTSYFYFKTAPKTLSALTKVVRTTLTAMWSAACLASLRAPVSAAAYRRYCRLPGHSADIMRPGDSLVPLTRLTIEHATAESAERDVGGVMASP